MKTELDKFYGLIDEIKISMKTTRRPSRLRDLAEGHMSRKETSQRLASPHLNAISPRSNWLELKLNLFKFLSGVLKTSMNGASIIVTMTRQDSQLQMAMIPFTKPS
jgi:hypothetical protein